MAADVGAIFSQRAPRADGNGSKGVSPLQQQQQRSGGLEPFRSHFSGGLEPPRARGAAPAGAGAGADSDPELCVLVLR